MKRIFVGSSMEALLQAERVEALLKTASCEVDLWKDAFPSGQLTIEAIEAEARRCSGAVFLATPDDSAVMRSKIVHVPRANVMLEYGYFIALLGRERVALCPYHGVELPTDLKGLTYISMGSFPVPGTNPPLTPTIRKEVRTWAAKLGHVAHGCRQVEVRHGYSGRWDLKSVFSRWRGLEVGENEFAHLDGYLDLDLERDESAGSGMLHGDFYVHVGGCRAHYRVCDKVNDVKILPDSGISLTSEFFSRETIAVDGTMPQSDGFESKKGSPNKVRWTLRPDPLHDEAVLTGTYVAMEGKHERSISSVTVSRVAS
jgi:hypothetical protein